MGLLHDDSFVVEVLTPGRDGRPGGEPGEWVFIHSPGLPRPLELTKDRRLAAGLLDPVYGEGLVARAVGDGVVQVGWPWRVVAEGWRGRRVLVEGVADVSGP